MVSLLVILSIIHCILHQVCRLTFQLSDLGRVEMSHPICCQFYAREKKPNFLTHFWHAILLCAVDLQLLITKEAWPHTCYLNECQNQSCQPPTSSNIENWWARDDSHNAHVTWCHLRKKNKRKRCRWNCNIWPNWLTSHQSHYCLYYNGIPEFVRKCSMLTVK